MEGNTTGTNSTNDQAPSLSEQPGKTEKTALVDNADHPALSGGGKSTPVSEQTNGETCGQTLLRVFCFPITLPLFFIKVFYFAFVGGLGSVLPFLSIYFKQMGLSPQQIGLISGLRPIIGFLSGPLWGAIADKYNIRRVMLLASILAWVGVYVGLAFVPSPEALDTCPEDLHAHRDVINIKRHTRGMQTVQVTNGTQNITDEEYLILKESIGWMYEPSSLQTVFIIILLLILLGEFFQSPTTALSDAGTIQTLGMENLDYYGSQRAWGPVGWAVSSVSVGALVSATRVPVDVCGVQLYFSNYFHFVYVFLAFMLVAFLSATKIQFQDSNGQAEKVELKLPSSADSDHSDDKNSHSTVAVIRIFLNVHYGSWLTTAFFVGICNGIIWGFLYWHLDNLGADQLLIGVASLVCALSEFLMFFFVAPLVKLIGHMGVMYIGLLMYAVRFAVYGALTNPWWVLPVELLQGVTFSMVWVSLTAYSAISVPTFSLATVQGILHGVYFGLGNGTGHLIGGSLIGLIGAPLTFYIMSVACVVALVVFVIAQQCSMKPDFTYQSFDDTSTAK